MVCARRASSRALAIVAGACWLLAAPHVAAQNLVSNPGFLGTAGQVVQIGGTVNPLAGGVPDSWRAFAVNGADVDLDIYPLVADEVYAGSPEANSVLFRVNVFGEAQGFDDDNGRTPLSPGVTYHAEFWIKTGNADDSEQTFNFGFPLFGAAGYLGIEPGRADGLKATAEWRQVIGPSFPAGADVTNGHISWRCVGDGGEDAILIALPAIVADTVVSYPALLTCRRDGRTVRLSWFNNGVYDALRVERDDAPLADLATDATAYEDLDVPDGTHVYRVLASVGGSEDGPSCEVSVYVVDVGTTVRVDLGEVDAEEGLANSQRGDGGDGETAFGICGPEADLRAGRRPAGGALELGARRPDLRVRRPVLLLQRHESGDEVPGLLPARGHGLR